MLFNFLDDLETFPARAVRQNTIIFRLKLNDSEISNFCDFKEFQFSIHKPNEMPSPFHKFHSIEMNRQKRLKLTAVVYEKDDSLRSFSPERRGCYFEGERQLKFFRAYTKANCDWECVTNYTLSMCGCVKFSMPRDSMTRVCGWMKLKCLIDTMEQWPNYVKTNKTEKPCNCLEPCVDIIYDFSIESDAQLIKYMSVNMKAFGWMKFFDHSAEVRESVLTYNLQNFIADIGGLLGLFKFDYFHST